MEARINTAPPLIMHIDLNSAFAMIEQQANPFLRGKPVAVTNRLSKGATIIAASYEAKAYGVGVGTKMAEAKATVPGIVVLETDPAKYIHAYKTFSKIITSYSPDSHMKSIDEGIIDFSTTRLLHRLNNTEDLVKIGQQIKSRISQALGEWVTCNIGIGPNRFLAKQAAGLHKPDGLDVVDHTNLLNMYGQLKLTDLTGINRRYARRLQNHGIYTPVDFFMADEPFLRKQVFKSIVGYFWYLRLRGWEVDSVIWSMKSVGRQYVLHEWTNDPAKLDKILFKMCERLGRRLRSHKLCANGLFLGCWHLDHSGWRARRKLHYPLYSTQEIFDAAQRLMVNRPPDPVVKAMSVTCYSLQPATRPQVSLFEPTAARHWQMMNAMDTINDRFGELTIVPAAMAGTETWVPDKIPFGTTRHF